MSDEFILEGILIDSGYIEAYADVIDRSGTAMEGDRMVSLDLSGLNLRSVPVGISDLLSLRELDLSDNTLSDLPNGLFGLGSLRVLDLSGNNLKNLPERISDLSSLRVLDLSGNQLEDIPDALLDMPQLERVLVSDNTTFEGSRLEDFPGIDFVFSEGLYPERACNWCGVKAGYRSEKAKSGSKWGFSKHSTDWLVCNNCGHIEAFYRRRKLDL